MKEAQERASKQEYEAKVEMDGMRNEIHRLTSQHDLKKEEMAEEVKQLKAQHVEMSKQNEAMKTNTLDLQVRTPIISTDTLPLRSTHRLSPNNRCHSRRRSNFKIWSNS